MIDASIPLGVKPAQIESPMNMLAQAMQIRQAGNTNELAQYSLSKARRQDDEMNALSGLLRDGGLDLSTPEGQTRAYSVAPTTAAGIIKDHLGNRKTVADIAESNQKAKSGALADTHKKLEMKGQALGWLKDNPTPENASFMIQTLTQQGILSQEEAASANQHLQSDPTPQGIAKLATMGYQAALSAKDQLPSFQTRNTGGTTDTLAINPITQAVTVTNSVKNTQSPDNAASNARLAADAAASRAQAEQHFQTGLNAPQYMETDGGLMALPKKLAPGQVPTGTPVMSADGGQPLGKPLKTIPPTVNGAIIQNSQSLNQIDRALTLLDGKNIGDPAKGGQQGDTNATGWKGYLPQSALNRIDPKGVDARAEVADIGSLKIHDRSGAAVTISESPRLMPFIPQATDDAVTVKKKLTRLRTELANEAAALQETYSRDQGYKPSPVKPGAAPTAAAPAPAPGFSDAAKESRYQQWKRSQQGAK